jgi:uridine kinase
MWMKGYVIHCEYGETMEQALCDVLKDVRVGKILIQTNRETDEPEVRTYFLLNLKNSFNLIEFTVILLEIT